EKVLATGEYTDDMEVNGMVYASAVRSAYPRAIVKAIRMEKALEADGILAIYTADDIPGSVKTGHLKQDWDAMIPIGKITHYLGDAICLVVGETREAVEAAKKLVEVDYEPLEMIQNPYEAMREGAPLVHSDGNLLAHKHVSRGNADKAIANAKYVVSGQFHTPFTEHAFLEPETAVAEPTEDGGVQVYSSDQGVYDTRRECAALLGLQMEKVRVTNKLVACGFGGKAEVISDTGAYASLGGPVLERACTHAAGPYNYQNFEIDGKAYYTNNPPAGAFRGFGVTQTCFAIESLIDEMAEKVGISPWEIRYRNAIRPGQELPNGQIVDESTGLVETLEAIKPIYDNNKYVGLACAMKNAGVGVGIADYGRCILGIKDGKVHIRSGASCIGQGLGTVLVQIVCDNTNLPRNKVVYVASNSFNAPDSGTTS